MSPADRLRAWIDSLSDYWKDRLRGWVLRSLAEGAQKFLDDAEPGARDNVKDVLTKLRDNPNTPPEIKALVERALEPKSWVQIVLLIIMGVVMVVQAVQTLFAPAVDRLHQGEERIAQTYRLDPISLITAWRRDPEAYEKYWDDLRDQGWSDERIEALKFLTEQYPPVPDMVRFADFGSFDPEVIAAWREFYDAPSWITEPMSLIGIPNEAPADWANKYWFSHWVQPGRYELGDMYRRGLMGTPLIGGEEIGKPGGEGEAEKIIKMAYRTMGYSSFWQERLLQLVREIPTRVDVRRWWDMRTIDEAELRSIYQRRGYFGKDLENYVVWTKVYVAFPDLIARWKNGWITLDEVRAELTGYGMPPDRLEELIQTKFKSSEGERVVKERDLTVTDIYKGVKQGVITRGEGLELLMDLGYDEDEADYKLTINIPVDDEEIVVKERELTKTDILKGLKAGILTEAQVLERLREIRYSQIDAELLLAIYKALVKPPTEPRTREASKADIVLAVKKGLITPEDGYLMLQDIGFTPEAAQFILSVRAEVAAFSPMSYQEFKDTTGKWRKAAGMASETLTEQIRQAAGEVVKFTKDLEALQALVREEEAKLVKEEVLPAEVTERRDKLRVALHRGESTLAAAQSHYDALVAEWRQKV